MQSNNYNSNYNYNNYNIVFIIIITGNSCSNIFPKHSFVSLFVINDSTLSITDTMILFLYSMCMFRFVSPTALQ